ncbi:MAG: DUF4258 domain-containing protein [Magnetococcales bacterium]|nr:DUF4258 domain-containing protein [Magnetococcales bacterium]
MFERDITQGDVMEALRLGVLVEDYPKDVPYPSRLLLGHAGERPLHVVAAREPESGICVVITVYIPGSEYWEEGWRIRR